MSNPIIKHRLRQTGLWTLAGLLMTAAAGLSPEADLLGVAAGATLLTAAVHAAGLLLLGGGRSGIEAGIAESGRVLASLYGHDERG